MDATSVPSLPSELYRNIADHFSVGADRRLLLSLALVDSRWRHESQRVLFSAFHDNYFMSATWARRDEEDAHIKFLSTILTQPGRLGGYVRLYAQRHLAAPAEVIEDHDLDEWQSCIKLWNLTTKALPVMVNLKYLQFAPTAMSVRPAEYFLPECTFQLRSLILGGGADPHLTKFLRTQTGLIHLDMGETPDGREPSWILDDLCEGFTSMECDMKTLKTLKGRQPQELLRLNQNSPFIRRTESSEINLTAFTQSKYLSINLANFNQLHQALQYIPQGVVFLELFYQAMQSFRPEFIPNLPSLRTLALVLYPTVKEDDLKNSEAIMGAFNQVSCLEHILVHSASWPWYGKTLLKVSVTRTPPNGQPPMLVVKRVEIPTFYEAGMMWWRVYDNV